MIPAHLFNEVLALPPEERREFALRVLDTVDDPTADDPVPADVDEAQYQEVLRRGRELAEGKATLIPWEQIKDELLPHED